MTNHDPNYATLAIIVITTLMLCTSISPAAPANYFPAPSNYHTISITEDGRLLSDYQPFSSATAPSLLDHDDEHATPASRNLFTSQQTAYQLTLSNPRSSSAAALDRSSMIRHAVMRSRQRVNSLSRLMKDKPRGHAHLKKDQSAAVNLNSSLTAMDFQFLISLEIGSPAQEITLIADTGSDLVWTQCEPCSMCTTQVLPIYDPSKSSTFKPLPCYNNSFCSHLSSNGHGSFCKTNDTCSYSYSYGDDSYTRGVLSTETLTLTSSYGNNTAFPGFVFGCGDINGPEGAFANSSGVLGLGQGLGSMTTQIGEVIDYQFSYCLVPWDSPVEKKGTLLMGKGAIAKSSEVVTIEMVTNNASEGRFSTFYYAALEGFSVGGKLLDIPKGTFDIKEDGTGGLIVDSGTTLSMFEHEAYNVILDAFRASMVTFNTTKNDDLDLCFTVPESAGNSSDLQVPSFALHFSNNMTLELPPENYFVVLEDNLCLAMAGNFGRSILGNIQQQNMQVGFDVKGKTLTMTPTTC